MKSGVVVVVELFAEDGFSFRHENLGRNNSRQLVVPTREPLDAWNVL